VTAVAPSPLFRVLLVVAAAVVAHAGAARGTFHLDDFHQIARNEAVHDVASIPRFFHDRTAFDADPRNGTLLRPLALATYAIDWRRGGGAPRAFLETQVALHAAAAAAALAVLSRAVWSPGAALFGALVFAVHPLACETVNLASARAGALASLFVLVYLAVRLGRGPLPAALAALALALLSKESAATAPALALILGLQRGEGAARRARALLPEAFVLAAFLAYRAAVLGGPEIGVSPDRLFSTGDVETGAGRGVALNLATQAGAVLRAALLALVPVRLSADHAVPIVSGLADPRFFVPAAAIAAAASAIAARSPLGVRRGALVFVVAAAPVIVVPLNVVLAEERYHLSILGVALAAGVLAERFSASRSRLPRMVAAGLVLLLAARSAARAADFRSETALWEAAVASGRAGPRAHLLLGNARLESGDLAGAVASYRRAAAASEPGSPARPFALLNLAEALRLLGAERSDAAIYGRSVRVLEPLKESGDPGLAAMARYRAGLALADRFERFFDPEVGVAAAREYRSIVEEHPDEIEAWRGLARVALVSRARSRDGP